MKLIIINKHNEMIIIMKLTSLPPEECKARPSEE